MALLTNPKEDLASRIAVMNRKQVLREITQFSGRFSLDFTRDFLESQSLNRLRHILLAAQLQQHNGY